MSHSQCVITTDACNWCINSFNKIANKFLIKKEKKMQNYIDNCMIFLILFLIISNI